MRRDLAALTSRRKIRRAPSIALSEYEERFPSYMERRKHSQRAKAKIASAALSFITPHCTCYFDAGTTMLAIAQKFLEHPVTPVNIVTSNIPVGELLDGIKGVHLIFPEGQLLNRQSVLLGETVRKNLDFWRFDLAFFSAQSMDSAGLWNTEEAIVEQQRTVLRRSASAVFCMDAGKLDGKAPHFLIPWTKVGVLITDAPRHRLKQAGITIRYSSQCYPVF